MWPNNSEGSITQTCAGSRDVVHSNIGRAKSLRPVVGSHPSGIVVTRHSVPCILEQPTLIQCFVALAASAVVSILA